MKVQYSNPYYSRLTLFIIQSHLSAKLPKLVLGKQLHWNLYVSVDILCIFRC